MQWIKGDGLEQVQQCLAERIPVIGGGTWLLSDGAYPPRVLDLREYSWAQGITFHDNGWLIGPDVTLSQWAQVLDHDSVILEVIRHMGSPVFRRVATVVGAIANPQPASDLYTVLRLWGAEIFFIDSREDNIQREKLLWPFYGEPRAIVGVEVPIKPNYGTLFFRKYAKGRMTRVLLTLGAKFSCPQNILTAQFVIGGLSVWPYEVSVKGPSPTIGQQIFQRLSDQQNIIPFYQALIREMSESMVEQWERGRDRRRNV